jgi:hypothetical protein
MKKIFSVMLATVLVLTIGVAGAFAASETYAEEFTNSNKSARIRRAYCAVDADGDGVCDNCPNGGVRSLDGTGKQNGKVIANQGDAYRNNVRACDGQRSGFVDSDGDGVCDNANGAVGSRAGAGNRGGRGMSVKIAK